MDMQWRQQNDWIHRNGASNELLIPSIGIRFCSQQNIRPKDSSSAEAVEEHFKCVNVPHLEQMKSIRPESGVFQTVSSLINFYIFVIKLNETLYRTWS